MLLRADKLVCYAEKGTIDVGKDKGRPGDALITRPDSLASFRIFPGVRYK